MTTTTMRRPRWNAMLCEETLEEIFERMQEVLGDGTYFTIVSCNSYSEDKDGFTAVDVQPSQWLTDPIRRTETGQRDIADDEGTFRFGLFWSTPRLSMGCSTGATTQAEGRDGGRHQYVHFTFEPDKVVIDHYAPAGYKLRWIFAVERHNREEWS